MAKLTKVYRSDEITYVKIGRRQIPLVAGDNLMMIMDLNRNGLVIDCPLIRGKELEEFTRKFNLLTNDELSSSLEVDISNITSILNQTVQCIGCRRSVEQLLYRLQMTGHPTLDPIVIKKSGFMTLTEDKLKTPQSLGTLLYKHHEILNKLLESKLRNKTRCIIHSLDSFRSRPFSESWRQIWSSMKRQCRVELAVIEKKELREILETYLKKHKFCQDCRTKVEKAYNLLTGDVSSKENGFVAGLYSNIKNCQGATHIHIEMNPDFLDTILRKAEPEINGSYSKHRERHAKTLEIAQEEVLTCVGVIMYERLRRVFLSMREEERACQLLAAVGVHALYTNFDTFVEKKQGISNLELMYQEINRAEKAKEHKRQQKNLKKKKKKYDRKNMSPLCSNENVCVATNLNSSEQIASVNCNNCPFVSVYAKSIDAGYGSGPSSHANSRTSSVINTPENSEDLCIDGCCYEYLLDLKISTHTHCNKCGSDPSSCDMHSICKHTKPLSLLQMLEVTDLDVDANYYIPDDVILEHKFQESQIKLQRQELRKKLKDKFTQLCMTKKTETQCMIK